MQANYYTTPNLNESTIIYENGSLNQFYSLTNWLSKSRHVRFSGKSDEAENIEWNFKYRGHALTLEYSIYNGIILYPKDSKDAKAMNELAGKLKNKKP